MTDSDFSDWLSQHGGERQRADETVNIREQDEGTGRITNREETYTTIVANDGATIKLKRLPAGAPVMMLDESGERRLQPVTSQYEILGQSTAAPKTATDTAANSPADRALDVEQQRERVQNQNAPIGPAAAGGGSGRYETHAERSKREADEALAAEAKTAREAATAKANAPATATANLDPITDETGRVIGLRDPKTGTVISIPKPVSDKPTTVTVGGRLIQVSVDGKTVTDVTPEQKAIPSRAGAWQPDMNLPDLGLFARRQQILQLHESGQITEAQGDKILKQDYELAQTLVSRNTSQTANEANIYQGDITQRGQDTVQANQRLSTAGSIFDNTLRAVSELNAQIQPCVGIS